MRGGSEKGGKKEREGLHCTLSSNSYCPTQFTIGFTIGYTTTCMFT